MSYAQTPAHQAAYAQQQQQQQQQQRQQQRQLPAQLAQLQQQVIRASQAMQHAQQQGNQQALALATQQRDQAMRAFQAGQQAFLAQQQQQGGQAAAAGAPSGITTRERDLGDGDDALRNAKRRKPTSRLLPLSFSPSLPPSLPRGATDNKLAPSLDSLDRIAEGYKKLQEIERKVDWTVERKRVELGEAAAGGSGGRGRQLKRTLRIHVTTAVHDQTFQLSPDELLAAAGDLPSASGEDLAVDGQAKEDGDKMKAEEGEEKKEDAKKTRMPRVEIKVTGEVLDDPQHTQPLSSYLHRLVLEPSSAPSFPPSANPSNPISWTRPAPSASSSLPASFTATYPAPTLTTLPLRLSLYLAHPAGDRFTLMPELAGAIDLAESDRVGILEAIWAYARERGLVVGPEEAGGQAGGPKGGIRTDQRLAKLFNNQPLVPYHLLPEYVNRLVAPAQPRVIDFQVPISADSPTSQHLAFDLDLFVPSPAQPLLDTVSRNLSFAAPAGASLPAALAASNPTAAAQAEAESRELAALDDKIALNCLAVATHKHQLDLLAAFTRDPAAFLSAFVESQAGSLNEILSSTASGGGGKEGASWREELRRASALEGEKGQWVEEAARVLGMRDVEGKAAALRLQQAQQQQQQAYGQAQGVYARR
ncbi:hypothetical protein JCM8547_003535 [Rhodosporidiobolus lusitaniae]